MIHLIKEIIDVEPFKITLRFNTGEIRQIDLADKLSEWATSPPSKFAELKNYEVFKQVKLDRESETLVWGNGIDLCPDVLYELSTEKRKKNVA